MRIALLLGSVIEDRKLSSIFIIFNAPVAQLDRALDYGSRG